jgi:hypothetical protein
MDAPIRLPHAFLLGLNFDDVKPPSLGMDGKTKAQWEPLMKKLINIKNIVSLRDREPKAKQEKPG